MNALWLQLLDEARAREAEIIRYYVAGENMEQLGKKYSLSRQRIHQILKRNELGRIHGGQFLCKQLTAEKRRARMQRKYGCSIEQLREYRDNGITAAYSQQRRNALTREIPWELTVGQFAALWIISGKWTSRGRHKENYVMARFFDKGPYVWGNVEIISCSDNVKLVRLRGRTKSNGGAA